MNEHPSIDPALRDQAIQYAFGTLEQGERARFEAQLAASVDLRALVEEYRELGSELGTLAPELAPPARVLARVRARIGASAGARKDPAAGVQPWKSWGVGEPPEHGVVFQTTTPFERTAIAGIEVRRLSLDVAADRVTIEVRMAPGTAYPAHRHGGVEECFVLEGDIDVGGIEMKAGDYQRVEAGSVHPVQSTREGCRLLIVSSLHDELI